MRILEERRDVLLFDEKPWGQHRILLSHYGAAWTCLRHQFEAYFWGLDLVEAWRCAVFGAGEAISSRFRTKFANVKVARVSKPWCCLSNLCNAFLTKTEAQSSVFFSSVFGSTVSARRARNGTSFWGHFSSVAWSFNINSRSDQF